MINRVYAISLYDSHAKSAHKYSFKLVCFMCDTVIPVVSIPFTGVTRPPGFIDQFFLKPGLGFFSGALEEMAEAGA